MFDKWEILAEACDSAVREQLSQCFKQYITAVCDMLRGDARQFSRLGELDERVYERLIWLMEVYREAAAAIADADEPDTQGLLAGLGEILVSRLRQFEDTALELPKGKVSVHVGDSPATAAANPITEEKSAIIERAVLYTARQIEEQAEQFMAQDDVCGALRRHFLLADGDEWHEALQAHMEAAAFDEMHSHYHEGLRFALLGIDDLHTRATTRLYTEWIERECEVLRDIVNVQAKALEEMDTAGGEAEYVMTLLRDALAQIVPPTENLQSIIRGTTRTDAARTDAPHRSYESFAEELHGALTPAATPTPPDPTDFFAALSEETDAIFGAQRITFLKAAYRLQRMLADDILLAQEATTVFNTTFQSLKKDRIEGTDAQMQIINGITETLEIKIDALKDGIADFNGQTASLLQAFAKEKTDFTDEIKREAYTVIRDAWLTSPPASQEDIPAFFAECQTGEAFAPYRADYEKHISRYYDKMEKACNRFKKEVLLYEIATYEEILTHSVSHLRGADSEHIQATAARLDGTYAALEVLLKKSSITPIRPAPHDVFNGKEHEVLVAEQHEGFEKGEIIKLVGSGYRFKDAVLVRANVIAAK